jgi:Raf kinase inhibitor-like YbhB/YbcL family protein
MLRSKSFQDGDWIPEKYTCDGEDISPELNWQNAPPGIKSFVLICEDPDAPVGVWDHWLIYDIPITVNCLDENIDKQLPELGELYAGAKQGINSWNRIGYGGPCPPAGTPHRYFFILYALDILIEKKQLNKSQLLADIQGHILEETKLVGKYQR